MICYCCCCWCSTGTSAVESRCTQSWGHRGRRGPSVANGAWLHTGGRGQLAFAGPPPATWAPAFAGGDDARACGESTQLSAAEDGPPRHTGEGVPQVGSSASMRLEGSRRFGRWGAAGKACETAEGSGEPAASTPDLRQAPSCDGAQTEGTNWCGKLSSVECTAVQAQRASAVAAPESSSLAEEKASCSPSSSEVLETRTSLAEAGGLPCPTSYPSLPAAAGADGT